MFETGEKVFNTLPSICLYVYCMYADLCGYGEDARRHVGNDIEQSRESADRTENKISYISGAILPQLHTIVIVNIIP